MAIDKGQSQEIDLDRTDRLPILDRAQFERDAEEEAAQSEYTASLPALKGDFQRPSGVDLPSLAESVRSVEERIARQSADYEALTRSYDKSRDAEAAASSRVHALAAELQELRATATAALEEHRAASSAALDEHRAAANAALESMRSSTASELGAMMSSASAELATQRASFESELTAVRSALDLEQSRAHDLERSVADRSSSAEAARARAEDASLEVERFQSEAETLRETLAARDAAVAQALHSLGERDTQLISLQREHAQLVPALEERVAQGAHLGQELEDALARVVALSAELKTAKGSVTDLKTTQRSHEVVLNSVRGELSAARTQSSSYLEQLSTREWRRGFDHNLFRELDAQIGAVQDDRGAIAADREQLRHQLDELRAELAAREEVIVGLKMAAADDVTVSTKQLHDLHRVESERSELKAALAALESEHKRANDTLAAQQESIARLQASAASSDSLRAQHERDLQNLDGARSNLVAQISTLEAERERLQHELAAKTVSMDQALAAQSAAMDQALATKAKAMDEALATASNETERVRSSLTGEAERTKSSLSAELERVRSTLTGENEHLRASLASDLLRAQTSLHAAEEARADMTADVERLKAEARERDDEMSVLMAHLHDARRPIQAIEAEVKRLSEDVAAKTVTLEALAEENRNLRLSVERTKGALEEREFLIRRLERSETNNANVLGRIQTSIERLGAPVPLSASAAQPVECSAEMMRIDGDHGTAYTLTKRTRIGRAPGCELRVDSSSVSRHHALILLGTRDAIIEDLNSTNGVIVNGRKVSRQMLTDGDVVTIGEAQFRFRLSLTPRVLEAPPAE